MRQDRPKMEETAQNAVIDAWKGPLPEDQQEQLQELTDEEKQSNNRHARNRIYCDLDLFAARRRPVSKARLSPKEVETRIGIQGAAVKRLCCGRHRLCPSSCYLLLRPIIWLLPIDRKRLKAGEFLFKHVQVRPGEPPIAFEFNADMLSADAIGGALELFEGRTFSRDSVRTLLFRTALTTYFEAMRDIAIARRQHFEKPEAVIAKIEDILVHIRDRGKQRGWAFVDAVFNEFLCWSNRV